MKRNLLLLALVPLAACNRIEEWHPKPDPKAEAAAKAREVALKRVDSAAAGRYYADAMTAGREAEKRPDEASRKAKEASVRKLPPTTGSLAYEPAAPGKRVSPTADEDKAAVDKAEALRRAAMVEQTRKSVAANAKARADAEERKLPGKGGDVTLPAPGR